MSFSHDQMSLYPPMVPRSSGHWISLSRASADDRIPQLPSNRFSVSRSDSDNGGLRLSPVNVSFLANGGSMHTKSMHSSFKLRRNGRLSEM